MQRFSGEVDMQSAMDFAAALDRVAGQRCDGVLLDLADLRFLSAAGLAIIAGFFESAERQGIPVALVCGRSVARPLGACRLDATVTICASLDAATSALLDAFDA